MRIFEPTKTPFVPRIRIINLVDVLFILLIFFIATSTFRVAMKNQQPTAVKLSLPEAKSAEAVGKQKTNELRITVTPGGTILVGEEKVTQDKLEKTLADAKKANPDVVLELSADKTVSYGVIVSIVDAARLAGIQNITAFTKRSVQ